jgi:hypothetical protein
MTEKTICVRSALKRFMESKACNSCHKELSIKKFNRWIGRYGICYRPECNECRNEIRKRKQGELLIAAHPDKYWQCEDENCNWIQSIKKPRCERCG